MADANAAALSTLISKTVYDQNLKALKETNEGASMRQPIVTIMKNINNAGRSATKFDGKEASEYLLKKDITTIKNRILQKINLSTTIQKDDQKAVTANAIRKVLGPIGEYP